MNPEIKRKWVKALLSGKYKQGRFNLKSSGRFCCLGVLRHVMDPHDDESECQMGSLLSERQLRRFGLTAQIQNLLADDLNDEGVPFDMIAGLIQEAL